MDKKAANNHLVLLQKEVKNAKNMVGGNLIRKIQELKKVKEKNDQDPEIASKMDVKIDKIYSEIKLLKTLDNYEISKQATLIPDKSNWQKTICDSLATTEQRLMGRVILKNKVQKLVDKFRSEHKDCDEWINEYIEFREKKKEIESGSTAKPKKFSKSSRNTKDKPQNFNRERAFNTRQNNETRSFKSNSKGLRNYQTKIGAEISKGVEPNNSDTQALHPSWEVKRREKELLKAALSGQMQTQKKIKFDDN